MGARLVAIVKEDVPGEVPSFREAVWQDADVLMDEEMAFYKGLYNGEVQRMPMWKILPKLLWIYVTCGERQWEKNGGNLKGEGLIQGGLIVVGTDGRILLQKQGDDCSPEEVIQALSSK
mmetsp:Transcript_18126/g.37769  ORF Transcript_18126/g.37769 Transcript_18126/m.37769 type:complete len:119 (-) Transcript_18126:149-505(-)